MDATAAIVSPAGAALILLLAVALVGCGGSERGSPPSRLAPGEKAYFQQIEVTGARMTAARNFLGQEVITLDAKVTNRGNRTVQSLELDLQFLDIMQQKVILDTVAHPITPETPPLKPGETRNFSVSFERMPDDWNQGPPRITLVRVAF